MPSPTATWFTVTRANAQKPQKTKACARPGRGRSRMTLAWQITSQKKSHTRLPIGDRLKLGSFRDLRMRWRIGPKRLQNRRPEPRINATSSSFSVSEKLCGSASVAERRFITELTHNTRLAPGSAGLRRPGSIEVAFWIELLRKEISPSYPYSKRAGSLARPRPNAFRISKIRFGNRIAIRVSRIG